MHIPARAVASSLRGAMLRHAHCVLSICSTSDDHAGGSATRLVGTDPLGNRYFEDNTRMYGRHRWVIYADNNTYSASAVHPQWHAWLHCISDDDPVSKPPMKRKFDVPYTQHPTGTADRYLPKGSWENPAQRNWGKVEFWQPQA